MRKVHKEEKLQTEETTVDILCNQCGRSCRGAFVNDQFQCAEVNAIWGYDSKWAWESHTAHLCVDCYEKLVANFTIPVETSRY